MVLYKVERVRDREEKQTHAATVTTDTGVFHADFFPILFDGMLFEEEEVLINGRKEKCYMPTGLGCQENKERPVGLRAHSNEKKSDEKDGEKKKDRVRGDQEGLIFELERMRRETMFYYCVKDFLSYNDIVKLTYSKSMNGMKDIYEKYDRFPYTLLCEMTSLKEDYFEKFPMVCKTRIPRTFEERLTEYRYGARYILRRMESCGDTWMPYGEFRKEFLKLFEDMNKPMRIGSPRAILEYFDEFTIDPALNDESKVSRTQTRMREMDILSIIDQYKNAPSPYPSFSPVDMDGFEDEQRIAILNSVISKGRLSIITGGPGVGKTTVLKKVIETMRKQYPDVNVRFLASTGKAANRIKETLGDIQNITISTIHKFVGWGNDTIWDSEKTKEIKESGLVIVDESSMMDLFIFSILINALDMQKTKVILVGDSDQLPSVEAGNILSDMIDLGVPCFHLTKNHRNNGIILENAKKIISGDPFLKENSFFKIVDSAPSLGWIRAGLEISDAYQLPEKKDIAAFSPYRTELKDGSASYINKLVQNSIFKGRRKCIDYYLGDRVVFTRTDYTARYFNGDIGILTGWKKGHYIVSVNGEERIVVCDSDIDLAYSLTIHKSQGSEYNEVLISIPKYNPFITRRMLYTAVTRAKDKVTIFASRQVVRQIILNNSDRNRRTFLSVMANNRKEKLGK